MNKPIITPATKPDKIPVSKLTTKFDIFPQIMFIFIV